ncbi:MAG: hypothetical protein U0840_29990 [Gemmataceae bacterium]
MIDLHWPNGDQTGDISEKTVVGQQPLPQRMKFRLRPLRQGIGIALVRIDGPAVLPAAMHDRGKQVAELSYAV